MCTMNDVPPYLGWLMDRVSDDHASRGQTYGFNRPYRKHLEDVDRLLRVACGSAWLEDDAACALLAAGILHDWFEDCMTVIVRDRSADVLVRAMLVWSGEFDVPATSLLIALRCTDPTWPSSRHAAKQAVLPGILACEGARCVKLADRIGNLQQSISDRSGKHLARYVGEAPDFAPVADLGMTPDDAVLETRCYAPVRVFLASQYLTVLEEAKKVLVELAHQP